VVFIGRKGGFGKTVVLKHAGGYETHYGHLSNYGKGLKVGSRVQQKDVIGFVGSTGVSTGPHLDYRISLNGNFKNPFSLKFKPRYTLSAEERVYFRKEIERLAALLEESGDLKVLQVKNIVFSEDDPIFLL
jgi:murein DD-endopeptidase MepM/ murein hydrolase activator NlpD